MKRNTIVDADTGRVDLRYNPLSVEEDYYIPVRGSASGTEISTVGGGQYTGDIDDVKYLRDKLFSALKIPMSYLSRGDGADEDKATLAQKDIRFARTVQRLQRSVVSELEKIAVIHLFTQGYRGNDLLSFKLTLNNPSKLAELQELEHWKARFEAADGASQGYFSRRWVARNILNINEEEFERMQSEMYYDRKHDFALEQVGEAAAAEAGGGAAGGLGGLGGGAEEGGGMDMPAPDEAPGAEGPGIPGAETPGADPAATDAPEDAGPLLATPGGEAPEGATAAPPPPPGKRDGWVSANAKGKAHYPKKRDDRSAGARKRSFLAMGGQQYTGASKRSYLHGEDELNSLYRFSEGLSSNYYDQEEKEIFQESYEVKKLIDSLEKKSDET